MSETPAQSASPPERSPRETISALSGWASLLLVVVAIVGLAWGHGPLRARAAQYNAVKPRVVFDWPPLAGFTSSRPGQAGGEPVTWVNAQIRGDLERTVLAKLSADPFDRAGMAAAREALLATGWLADDLRLDRDADGTVRVAGTWRIPAAAVRFGGQDRLVAWGGELLPVSYRPDASGYKVIIGAKEAPPEPGKVWLGGDVQAGLRLIAVLGGTPCTEQVAGVDVSEYGASRTLAIVTDMGSKVLWGGPVDDFNPGQAAPAIKLQRLAQVCRDFGRIDAGRGVLDVRLIDGVFVHDTAGVLERARQSGADAPTGKNKPKKTVSR